MTTRIVMVPVVVNMPDKAVSTGWYGRPGHRGGVVHVRLSATGRPLCGQTLPIGSEFQWCSWGITEHYVECLKCKRICGKVAA